MSDTRFYGELAVWWPLISPVGDYAEEASYFAGLLRSGDGDVRTVLELGSGGGSNAHYLGREFEMTLVDLSEDMLAVSSELNPGCEHFVGDMRTVRPGRTFDAVFIHDAIDYMCSEADLAAAMTTAFVHLRAGGRAVLVPDDTAETFAEESAIEGHDGHDGRAVRVAFWTTDPDPADTTVRTDYVFLLRDADGSVRSVHENPRHRHLRRSDLDAAARRSRLRGLVSRRGDHRGARAPNDLRRPPPRLGPFVGRIPADSARIRPTKRATSRI